MDKVIQTLLVYFDKWTDKSIKDKKLLQKLNKKYGK